MIPAAILFELAATLRGRQPPSWDVADACADLASWRYKLKAWHPQGVCSGAGSQPFAFREELRAGSGEHVRSNQEYKLSSPWCKERILRKAGSQSLWRRTATSQLQSLAEGQFMTNPEGL